MVTPNPHNLRTPAHETMQRFKEREAEIDALLKKTQAAFDQIIKAAKCFTDATAAMPPELLEEKENS